MESSINDEMAILQRTSRILMIIACLGILAFVIITVGILKEVTSIYKSLVFDLPVLISCVLSIPKLVYIVLSLSLFVILITKEIVIDEKMTSFKINLIAVVLVNFCLALYTHILLLPILEFNITIVK